MRDWASDGPMARLPDAYPASRLTAARGQPSSPGRLWSAPTPSPPCAAMMPTAEVKKGWQSVDEEQVGCNLV